jgi:serine/threonine protein kinase
METLGKYKIEAKLGQGAMGCVYKAWHPGFHDFVSLKTIQDTRLENAELLERFKREGRALAKLKHQNIVQIYDADQADGMHFIVMEYMNGGSLDRIIEKRDGSPLALRLGYIVPACHALSYAHRRGLFHRDIKPANIMLHNDGNDEVVKVVDFGIARLVDLSEKQDFSMSQTNMLIGSPAYMAPELLTGTDRANERTDIWALGVTLYELLALERPFQGEDFAELRRNIIHAKARPLKQLAPDCPSDLDTVVQRMIEKDASLRYATVEDLLIDLEPIAKRLRSETAASLIHRANDLCEIGEMESAKSVLTEARKYDPANSQLRNLLQKIDKELRRRELLPRLHTHLKRARDFAHRDEYQNAREEIASALSLDSSFAPARKFLEDIEEEAKKKELLQEKLRLIKLRITEGELTQAEMFLKEVEQISIGNAKSQELRREIEQEKQHRLKRKRINELVSECLVLLSQGLLEYPEDAELLRLQEIVRGDLAEAKRQQERQRGIEELRALVGQGDFEAARKKMQQLLQEFPDDAVVENLKSFIVEETGKAEAPEHDAAIDAGIRTIRKKLRSKKHADAAAAEENTFSETRSLLANGKKHEALLLAQGAIDTRVFKKNDARVVALMNEIENAKTSDRETLQTIPGGNTAAVHEAIETEMKQSSFVPSERASQVASDWRFTAEPVENDLGPNADPAPAEGRIELPMTGAGGKKKLQNLSGGAVRPDATSTNLPLASGVPRSKARLIGFLAGAVVVAGFALLIAWRISSETAKKESIAFQQATQDENEKKWPIALTEYQALAAAHGALSAQAGSEYTRLAALLQKERELKQNIEQTRAAKSYDQAEMLLTQLADLHGDMEAPALEEKDEVAKEAQLEAAALQEKNEKPKVIRATRIDAKENAIRTAPGNPEVPAQASAGCELSASDLPVRLNRADRNSAKGNYDSAEREYLAVLACQPNNEQARSGLERTRKAKAM